MHRAINLCVRLSVLPLTCSHCCLEAGELEEGGGIEEADKVGTA